MPTKVRKRLFSRVVLWQPSSGTIFDLPTRYVLPIDGPNESEEYARTTDGSKRPIRRNARVQVPVTNREFSYMGKILRRTNCPFKAVFLGVGDTDLWFWGEPTRLQVVDAEHESLSQAARVFDLETDIFYPAVWEGLHLNESVPWRGTTEQTRNGDKFLRPEPSPRRGYEGPLWSVPDGASVNLVGQPSGIDSNNPATLRVEFPVWGATVSVDDREGSLTGTVEAQDWDGNVIGGPASQITLPDKTWYVKATVEDCERPPLISVQPGNDYQGVQEGAISPDCSRVASPTWNDTDLVLTDENV